ncbi:MAG TPA: VOC family protein [Actinomycetes bacterium]|nr:VOC family protein [Actinomycetes bacterium]
MDQSMSLLTLGVRDLAVARRFYVEGLGWRPTLEVPGDVTFIKVSHGLLLALWSRASLAAEAGGVYQGDEPAPIALAHMVPDAAAVARVLDEAVAAGATLIAPATQREWGGVTGYFADPDDYRWEVAWNPSTELFAGEGEVVGPR